MTKIPEEISDNLKRLFEYFGLQENEEWPWIQVYTGDGPTMGVIEDDLYQILSELQEATFNNENEEEDTDD